MKHESRLTAALNTRIEAIEAGESLEIVWPRTVAKEPSEQHLTVQYTHDLNERSALNDDHHMSSGILALTLVTPPDLDWHEIVLKKQAENIADYFVIDEDLENDGTTVSITSYSIRTGVQLKGNWETPIWLYFTAL